MELSPPVNRRRFLFAAGIGGLVLATRAGSEVALTAAQQPTRLLYLRRRADFLNLSFALYNADVLTTADGAVLQPVGAGRSYLVVRFPPQAVLERALAQPLATSDVPLTTRVSGDSRLAFDITDALPMPCTVGGLLSWTGLTPHLAPTATTLQTSAGLVAPTDIETAVEIPWRVQLSPDETGRWDHVPHPVTHNGWTELWHTRLAAAADPTVRAVWLSDAEMPTWVQNPGTVPAGNTDGLEHVLTAKRRYSIVKLSADPAALTVDSALPRSIDVNRLTLSSLGGWLDATARWNPTAASGLDLTEWQHKATMGRDHFVRTAEKGYLFPFGHRASLVTVAERRFARRSGTGPWYAYLHYRQYVTVQQTVRTYEGDTAMPHGQRKMPFTRVRVVSTVSPDLEQPLRDFVSDSTSVVKSFVVKMAGAGGAAFPMHLRGTDWAGKEVDFTCPTVFVLQSTAQNTTDIAAVHTKYNTGNTAAADALRTADAGGRKIAVAPAGVYEDGSTTVTAGQLVLNSEATIGNASQLLAAGKAPFYPHMERAHVRIPEIAALVGGKSDYAPFEYAGTYLTAGFGGQNNPGAVYLTAHSAVPTPPPLTFAAESAGGMATPSGTIKALSAKNGPVTSNALDAAKELFNPAEMFGDPLKSKLLGGIPLKDVLPPMPGGNTSNPSQTFRTSYRTLTAPERHQALLDWTPEVKAGPGDLALFEPQDPAKTLAVHTVTTLPVGGAKAAFEVYGELRKFALHLFGKGAGRFITVEVEHLRFSSGTGAKTTVDCKLTGVSFHGPLSFVEKLAELCKLGGSKLEIVVGGAGIQASLRLGLPAVSLGPFGLKNIAIGAGVTIPFDGSAVRVNFDICTRENPFQLTVSFFTGGGYAGIALGADGVERLEIGFVFGAALELNLGVASGGIECVGGISYLLEKVDVEENGKTVVRQQTALTAFLRMRGRLSILGLVHLSLEFYLGLTYQEKTDGSSALVGEARMTVSVDILFFSASVTLTVRRELSATSAPSSSSFSARALAAPVTPTHAFGTAYTEQDWTDYCAAFAPVGA